MEVSPANSHFFGYLALNIGFHVENQVINLATENLPKLIIL